MWKLFDPASPSPPFRICSQIGITGEQRQKTASGFTQARRRIRRRREIDALIPSSFAPKEEEGRMKKPSLAFFRPSIHPSPTVPAIKHLHARLLRVKKNPFLAFASSDLLVEDDPLMPFSIPLPSLLILPYQTINYGRQARSQADEEEALMSCRGTRMCVAQLESLVSRSTKRSLIVLSAPSRSSTGSFRWMIGTTRHGRRPGSRSRYAPQKLLDKKKNKAGYG